MPKKVFYIIFLLVLCLSAQAQNTNVADSLPFTLKHLSVREQADRLNALGFSMAWKNPERVTKYAEEALRKSESIGHLEGIGRAYHNLGNASLFLGAFYKSLEHYQKAQQYYDSAGMSKRSFGLKGDIAEVYAEIEDFERSEELLLEIIPQQQELRDTLEWSISLRRYALLLSNQKNYSEALAYLEKSLILLQTIQDSIGIGLAHSDLGNIYLQTKDYKSAGEHLMQAAIMLQEDNIDIGFLKAVNRIGRLLIETDKYDMAITHLTENLQIAQKIHARPRILEAYALLSEVYKKKDDYQKAFEYNESYTQLKDSVINMQKSEQIASIQVKYNAKAQQLELEELKNNKNIQGLKIWFLLILIIFSSTSLIFWLIHRRKAEKKLKEQFIEIEKKNQLIKLKHVEIEEANKELTKAQRTIASQNDKLKDINSDLEDEVKNRTSELRKAVDRLTIANQELDSLIFHSSHNLKSPLTSLKGLSMLGNLESKDTISKLYFNKIERETEVMLRLQKNLMLIHDIKYQESEMETIRLADLMNALRKQYQVYIARYGATIQLEISNDIILKTQSEWLMSVLKNLVENSIFFCSNDTPPKVNIRVVQDRKFCKIHIEDNGTGIHPNNIPNMFEMFFRGASKSGGSGLGLYVSQLAINRLKGSIQLIHSSEKGTHFCISLPI